MKHLGFVLAIVGMCFIALGIAFNFCVKLNVFQEYFIKSRLTDILVANRKKVVWERRSYGDLPLALREGFEKARRGEIEELSQKRVAEELQRAGVVHFIETSEKDTLFFFERSVYIPPGAVVLGTKRASTPEIPDIRMSPILHSHGGNFQVMVGGKLNVVSLVELQRVFSLFEEVKVIGEWQGEVAQKGLQYGFVLGVLFILLGGGSLGLSGALLFFKPSSQHIERASVATIPTRRERVKVVASKFFPDDIEVVREKTLIPEDMRREFLHEVEAMIDQSEGDMRDRLEKIKTSLREEQLRPSKLGYHFDQARRVFAGVTEEEAIAQDAIILQEEIETFPAPGEIDFRSKEGLDKLLHIDSFLPDDLNPACVKAIILWLLRGGKNPYFGDNSRLLPQVRRSIVGKGFSPEEWEVCFDWLTRKGVLLYRKPHKRKEFTCSLNPDPGSVPYPGEEIIRVAIRAGQLLAKR